LVSLPKPPPASGGFWNRFTFHYLPCWSHRVHHAGDAAMDEWVGSATIQTTSDAYIR
jgi:hypothetical protein